MWADTTSWMCFQSALNKSDLMLFVTVQARKQPTGLTLDFGWQCKQDTWNASGTICHHIYGRKWDLLWFMTVQTPKPPTGLSLDFGWQCEHDPCNARGCHNFFRGNDKKINSKHTSCFNRFCLYLVLRDNLGDSNLGDPLTLAPLPYKAKLNM